MSDKDLLVVISEMLRKQDQQAEKLDEHSTILNRHTKILEDTNDTLKNFVDISVQQFQHQQLFNEQFLSSLNEQREFNKQFLSKLDEISKKP